METRLMIEGNAVYELEEECLRNRRRQTGPERPEAGQEKRRPGGRRGENRKNRRG